MANDELLFLQSIRRQPRSDTHRLAYADWLTDRGDPRGEFIRCQVKASRLPKASLERIELEAAARDLLLLHEAEWLGPLLDAAGNWEWAGGLLAWVTVSVQDFLASAKRWLPGVPLLGIHLRQVSSHVRALARCEQLEHLNALYLGDNRLKDADVKVLAASPHLKQIRILYLHSNEFGDKGLAALAKSKNLPRLRELSLAHNRFDDDAVATLARSPQLRRLRSLNMMMALRETGWRSLVESPELKLQKLQVGVNLFPAGCLAQRPESPIPAGLKVLGYDMNGQDSADIITLARSPAAAELRMLSLQDGTYDDAALKALARSPHLAKLTSLSISTRQSTKTGLKALGGSRTLKSLRTLSISGPPGPIETLLKLPLVRRLTWLDLQMNGIDAKGFEALASHTKPLRLRVLNLPMTGKVGPAWEALLGKQLLSRLTALTLHDPPADAVRALLEPGQLPDLRRLRLHGIPSADAFHALLNSPLFGRLHTLDVSFSLSDAAEKKQGSRLMRDLLAVWKGAALRRLGLFWNLSDRDIQELVGTECPPSLTELAVGSFDLHAESMAALAASPLLRQLRQLVFHISSHQDMPGLEHFITAPEMNPLLRIDIRNGSVPDELIPGLRKRFGYRFAVDHRQLPRTVSIGGFSTVKQEYAD